MRDLEQAGFQARLALGGISAILAALGVSLAAVLATLFFVALFPCGRILLLLLEKEHECRNL